jgi:hypothetical protein
LHHDDNELVVGIVAVAVADADADVVVQWL